MQYFKDHNLYKVVRVTGPTHNYLGVSFGAPGIDEVAVEPLKKSGEAGESVDEDELVQAVAAGVRLANATFGTSYQVAGIQYIPADAAMFDVYSMLANKIVERMQLADEYDGAD